MINVLKNVRKNSRKENLILFSMLASVVILLTYMFFMIRIYNNAGMQHTSNTLMAKQGLEQLYLEEATEKALLLAILTKDIQWLKKYTTYQQIYKDFLNKDIEHHDLNEAIGKEIKQNQYKVKNKQDSIRLHHFFYNLHDSFSLPAANPANILSAIASKQISVEKIEERNLYPLVHYLSETSINAIRIFSLTNDSSYLHAYELARVSIVELSERLLPNKNKDFADPLSGAFSARFGFEDQYLSGKITSSELFSTNYQQIIKKEQLLIRSLPGDITFNRALLLNPLYLGGLVMAVLSLLALLFTGYLFYSKYKAYRSQFERNQQVLRVKAEKLEVKTVELVAKNLMKKKYLKDINEQKNFLEGLINAIPEVIVVKDKEGYYRKSNFWFKKYTQLDEGLLQDHLTDYDFMSEKSADKVLNQFIECLNTGNTIKREMELCFLNHQPLFFEVLHVPINHRQELNSVIMIMRDITEQRKRESEYRKLYAALDQGLSNTAITNLNGELEYVNKGFLKSTGYEFHEVIGKNPKVLKSGYHAPDFYDKIWATILEGKEWLGEFCNKAKDGSLYWELANIVPLKNDDGEITHFVKVAHDITQLKNMQNKLRENEMRFQQILDSIQDLVVVYNADKSIDFANKAYKSFYINDSMPAMPVSYSNEGNFYNNNSFSDQVIKIEEELKYTQNGDIQPFSTIISPLKDEQGKTVQVVSVSRDISEKKEQEFKNSLLLDLNIMLGETSEKTEALNRIIDFILVIPDIDACAFLFKDMETNDFVLEAQQGYVTSHLTNKVVFNSDQPISRILTKNEITVIKSTDLINQYNIDLKSVNMQVFVFIPVKYQNQVIASVCVASEYHRELSPSTIHFVEFITSQLGGSLTRINAEKANMVIRANFQNLFNTIHDFIFITDLLGKIKKVNTIVTEKLGYTEEELIGMPIHQIHPKEFWQESIDILREKLSKLDEIGSFEFYLDLQARTGELISCSTRVIQGNWDGEPVLIGISRDISEITEYQKELELAKEQAEAANKAKSRFLATISHEIRTPLNSILGFGRLMEKNMDEHDLNLGYAEAININGKILLSLINDVLDLAKIDAGKMAINPTPVNLKQFFTYLAGIYTVTVREKKDLMFFYEQSGYIPPVVYIDEQRLRQIVGNIISNAIKFTEKGFVKLSINGVLYKKDMFKLSIDVIDTGIGIKQEFLNKIFLPFEQQSNQDTRKYGGTGLGLAISKELIDAMGGRINALSKPGSGTTFNISFENLEYSNNQSTTNISDVEDKVFFNGEKILVIDDLKYNRMLFTDMLNNMGLQPMLAKDVKEAIELLESHKVALVIMDVKLNGYNGLVKAEPIKQKHPYLPVVAISSSVVNEGYPGRSMFADFILKPIDELKIQQTIKKHIKLNPKEHIPSSQQIKDEITYPALPDKLTLRIKESFDSPYINKLVETAALVIEHLKTLKEHENTNALINMINKKSSSFDIDGLKSIFKKWAV